MTSKRDQDDIERRLQSIIGSMRISGGEPTEETIITMRGILSGALNADEEIARTVARYKNCLLYTSPSPRDLSTSRMPSSA